MKNLIFYDSVTSPAPAGAGPHRANLLVLYLRSTQPPIQHIVLPHYRSYRYAGADIGEGAHIGCSSGTPGGVRYGLCVGRRTAVQKYGKYLPPQVLPDERI